MKLHAEAARRQRALPTTDILRASGDITRRNMDRGAGPSTTRGSFWPHHPQSGRVEGFTTDDPQQSFVAALLTALRKRICQAIPPGWLIPGLSEGSKEAIISTYGRVEIRLCPPSCAAQTYVKGELGTARMTGLRRLAKYVTGDNHSARCLATARPLEQQQQAPGRWLVRIRLPTIEGTFSAPAPSMGKVRVIALAPELLAVIPLTGRPTSLSLAEGEKEVLATIAGTKWMATGAAMTRLHRPVTALPFVGGYEVAVPIADRRFMLSNESSPTPRRTREPTQKPL